MEKTLNAKILLLVLMGFLLLFFAFALHSYASIVLFLISFHFLMIPIDITQNKLYGWDVNPTYEDGLPKSAAVADYHLYTWVFLIGWVAMILLGIYGVSLNSMLAVISGILIGGSLVDFLYFFAISLPIPEKWPSFYLFHRNHYCTPKSNAAKLALGALVLLWILV